jgi:hypothetical protein
MHDDQFTAMGPPFKDSGFEKAGFSTLSNDVGFEFGMRALARRCGVMGQTEGGGIAAIYGHGNAPQFGVLGTAFGDRIGVVGANVVNTNDLMNLNVPPEKFALDSLGHGSGTGVLGTTGSGTGVLGTSQSGAGVEGGSETGVGVHGHGGFGPGGVFESANAAQVRLIPRDLISPEGRLPGDGGALLVTSSAEGFNDPECRLWFCRRAGDAESAVWELVAGSRPFPGFTISVGATGIDVRRLQMQLNLVAAAGLLPDGEFGTVTEQAVVDFQTRHLIAANGMVDVDTWAELFALT